MSSHTIVPKRIGWRRSTAARLVRYRTLLAGVMTLSLLRVPSLLEPRWYSDESTYAYIGRTVLHGGVVYSTLGAWDNKPPPLYWTYGLIIKFFGTSEASLHAFGYLAGLLTVIAAFWTVSQLNVSARRQLLVTVATAILLGLPIFDGDILLPECILIAPVSWAIAIFLTHIASTSRANAHPKWPYLTGFLLAVALSYQQTVLCDVAAVSIACIAIRPVQLRALGKIWAVGLITTLLWLIPTLLSAGWSKVSFALVFYFLGYVHNSSPASQMDRILHLVLLTGSFGLIVLGAALIARKTKDLYWVAWLWAGCNLLVPAAANYPYPHLLLPALPALALAVGITPWGHWQSVASRRFLRFVPLGVGVLVAAQMGSVAGTNWLGGGRSLVQYYLGGYQSIFNPTYRANWQLIFNSPDTQGDAQTAAWLSSHAYNGSSAVVWAESDEWVYSLSDLRTTLPAVTLYNDNVLVNGAESVGPYVGAHRPRLIIVQYSSLAVNSSVEPVLAQYYHRIYSNPVEGVYLENAGSG